ncbi:Angiotensin-converting enzyme 2 protein [Dioscorea alata]|uniref:Angiotensin-converting enzyme 2 protein n=1 Tax=Dioscorea alata TaxID=55571 RepID=A0ACB7U2L3_DIOAL|nr:Angiotensin-converting enzyme 2 protein [Dioscorea alata]
MTVHLNFDIFMCFPFSVWKQLEENNQVFFGEYYLRLVLMEQCMEFNKLAAAVIEAKGKHTSSSSAQEFFSDITNLKYINSGFISFIHLLVPEAQNASNVAQQTPALVTPGNALCNGGTWNTLMGNGNDFNGIPSSQNGNMQVCQGMNGMDQFSFSAGAPSLGFSAPQYGYINQAPPNYNKSNVRPQGISVAPCSTSNNLGLMEQQQFNMPTTVDGFLGQSHSFDQFFSWPAVNGLLSQASALDFFFSFCYIDSGSSMFTFDNYLLGVPGNEAKVSNHASGVQNFSNDFVGFPSSSQYFMQ